MGQSVAAVHHSGSAVRVGPDEVSFNSAQSYRDIYGARAGHKPFRKSEFYSGGSFTVEFGTRSIISETDPEAHKQMRASLAGAFSERSINEQEHLVSFSIDKFMCLVGHKGARPEGVDMTEAFEALTFDITGDLAFGEPFGALDNGK
ncbi:hypothetical protein MGN70_000628 [Eutypa lata]|nr:hypothetical protein MGN70_000628 [Eutypa lata]